MTRRQGRKMKPGTEIFIYFSINWSQNVYQQLIPQEGENKSYKTLMKEIENTNGKISYVHQLEE